MAKRAIADNPRVLVRQQDYDQEEARRLEDRLDAKSRERLERLRRGETPTK